MIKIDTIAKIIAGLGGDDRDMAIGTIAIDCPEIDMAALLCLIDTYTPSLELD